MSSVFAGLCVECPVTPYRLFLGSVPQLAVHQRLLRHMQPVHAWYTTRKRIKEQANEYMELDLASCDAEVVLRYAHVHFVRRNVYHALFDKQVTLLEAGGGDAGGGGGSKTTATSTTSATSATTARIADAALLTCLAECNHGCVTARLHEELQTLQAAKRRCRVAGRRELDATLPLEPCDYLCMMRVVEEDATAGVVDAEMRARAYLPRAHIEAKASELVQLLSSPSDSSGAAAAAAATSRAPRAALDRREQKLLQRLLPGDYGKVGVVEKLRPVDVTAYYAFCAERLCSGALSDGGSSSHALSFTRALWAHVFRKYATHPGYLAHISCYWAHHSGLQLCEAAAAAAGTEVAATSAAATTTRTVSPSLPALHMPMDVAHAVCTQQQLFPALKYRAQYLYTAPEYARQQWRSDSAIPLLRVYGALGAHAAEHLAAGMVVEAAWARLQLAADDNALDEGVLRSVREYVANAASLYDGNMSALLKRVEEGAQLLCTSTAATTMAVASLYTDDKGGNDGHVAASAAAVAAAAAAA